MTIRHYVAIALAIVLFIVLLQVIGADGAFLITGILFMLISNASYRLPLVLAILGLMSLMGMSPFVHEGNSIESFSESIAVWVFFMLIFGVAKMVYDEIARAFGDRPKSLSPERSESHQEYSKHLVQKPPIPQSSAATASIPTQSARMQKQPLRNSRQRPSTLTRHNAAQSQQPRPPTSPKPVHQKQRVAVSHRKPAGNHLDLSKATPIQNMDVAPPPKPKAAKKQLRTKQRPQNRLIQG